MDQYKEVIDSVIKELEDYDSDREQVIRLTRKLNRASGRGIGRIIQEEEYQDYLDKSRQYMSEIADIMTSLAPITSWSTTNSGTEEYCEFEILHAIVNNNKIPSPSELSAPSWIWITGLADVIGELRRILLNKIIQDDLDHARIHLGQIQKLYDMIVGLEFSKSLVSSLRHKIDVARTLVDKCESDFANAVIHKQSKTVNHDKI